MGCRALVVDDDVVVGMSLSFSEEEVEVTDVARITDAMDAARTGGFDVAIVDRRLPDGDGLELVRMIRADPSTKSLPVIVLTAGFDEADRDEVMTSGADDYLGKPIEPADLMAAVARIATPSPDLPAEPVARRQRFGRRARRTTNLDADSAQDNVPSAPIETLEQTLRRERDAADRRAAKAIVKSTETATRLIKAREEIAALRSQLEDRDQQIAVLEKALAEADSLNEELLGDTSPRRPLHAKSGRKGVPSSRDRAELGPT